MTRLPIVDPQVGRVSRQSGSLASLLAGCALLAAALLPLAAGIAWFAYGRSGWTGVAAAALAGVVCWVSACLALVAGFCGQELGNPVAGILGGMLFRLGLPLATGVLIQAKHAPLAQAGCFTMILGLYLVALVIETLLSLRFVPQSTRAASGIPSSSKAN